MRMWSSSIFFATATHPTALFCSQVGIHCFFGNLQRKNQQTCHVVLIKMSLLENWVAEQLQCSIVVITNPVPRIPNLPRFPRYSKELFMNFQDLLTVLVPTLFLLEFFPSIEFFLFYNFSSFF